MLIIKNARVFINNTIQPAEIAIDEGKILEIRRIISIKEADKVIDAKTALVLPGGIDIHVHFRDPGMTNKENWYTGSCAAAAGGITMVIDHPNTLPPTIDVQSFKMKLKAAKKSIIDYGINAGVTQNFDPKNLKQLWNLGVMAFGEIFMTEFPSNIKLKEAFEIIGSLGAIACIHAEDKDINRRFTNMVKKHSQAEYYSEARPELSERKAVERALILWNLSQANTKLHFCHISSHESLEIIRKAKNITCEVAPHHLFLSTKDWRQLGVKVKTNPPLRDFHSQQSLWKGLNNGTINVVASDHAPHLEHEKIDDVWDAPPGVPGVETMLPLMLMAVKRNLLTLKRFIQVISTNPARMFHLNKGMLAPGYDADMIIIGNEMKIRKEKMHSRAGWTPYNDMQGIFPKITISGGEVVFEDGEIIGKRGRGKFIAGKGIKKANEKE